MTSSRAYRVEIAARAVPDPVDDNVDVTVYFDDGTKYVATFFTLANIQRLFVKNQMTGECAGGKYFWASDMIIVGRLDPAVIEEAVADLLRVGEFEMAFDGPHPVDPSMD